MMNTPKSVNAPKWMRTALLAALAAVVAAGCNNDEIETDNNRDKQRGKMTIHVATGEKAPGTRVAYDDDKVGTADGNALTWQTGDRLAVVLTHKGRYMDHADDYLYQGEDGDTFGSFEGTKIDIIGGNWAVYYPHTVNINADDGTGTLPMTGQTQEADGSTAHLRKHMLLEATNLTSLADGFSLEMKSSIMKFKFTGVPTEVGELKELVWIVETANGNRSVSLKFASGAVNFGKGNSDGTLTAYLAFMPQDMEVKTGGKFTVILIGDKNYRTETTVTDGKTYEAGKRYTSEIASASWQEVATMAMTVKMEYVYDYLNNGLTFNIPVAEGDYVWDYLPADLIVIWGDGNVSFTVKKDDLYCRSAEFNHTYPAAGTYTVTIISDQPDDTQKQIPEFNFYQYRTQAGRNREKIISIDSPLLNMGEPNTQCYFEFCHNLQSIPHDLFYKNTKITNFSYCFDQSGLQSIPEGLFDRNTEATDFTRCFSLCPALQSIPKGLFDKNTEATNFQECFSECPRLILNKNIFSTSGSLSRFSGKQMDFFRCFFKAGSDLASGAAGEAPELWNYNKGSANWSTGGCFEGANNLNNWNDIPTDWGGPKVTN